MKVYQHVVFTHLIVRVYTPINPQGEDILPGKKRRDQRYEGPFKGSHFISIYARQCQNIALINSPRTVTMNYIPIYSSSHL